MNEMSSPINDQPPRLNIVLQTTAEPKADPANILLVDDKPSNLIALEAVLNSPHYRLVSAFSGEEALKLLEKEDFALVLLDIQMPAMDGFQTAEKIKSNDKTKDIPIIFITAIFTEDPHIRRGYQAGGVDYFGKPFDVEILQRKVGIYTKLYHQRKELMRRNDQQKKIEALLRARNEELEHHFAERTAVLETVSDALFVGRGRRISDLNRVALKLFGFNSQEEINKDLVHFAESIRLREAITGRILSIEEQPYFRALRGERTEGKFIIRNVKTGDDTVIHSVANPVFYRNKVISVVWSVSE